MIAMAFDLDQFRTIKTEPRTATVAVSGLKPFFPEDTTPEWQVRSLSGAEVAMVREEVERNRAARQAISHAEQSGLTEEVLQALRTLTGAIPGTVPDEHVRYLTIVRLGSAAPEITHQDAVRLAEIRPIEFMAIGQEILRLTGLGAVTTEKSKPSGETQE